MASSGFNPTIMMAQGEASAVPLSYAEDLVSSEVATRTFLGHDGKFFFAQAVDPWIASPQTLARVLDFPTYRAQRMLYPLVASGFGTLSPDAVVWGLIVANVMAVGVGGWFTARLAESLGASAWVGLAFPLNPGVLGELDIDGSGVFALCLGLASLLALRQSRVTTAALLMSAAVLSRETMLLFAVGALAGGWFMARRWIWPIVVWPILSVSLWRVYTTLRFSGLEETTNLTDGLSRNFTVAPLGGLVSAFGEWQLASRNLVWGLALIGLLFLFTLRAVRTRTPESWSALPFVALAVFASAFVWKEPYDIARATAPVFTAYALLLFSSGRRSEHVFD